MSDDVVGSTRATYDAIASDYADRKDGQARDWVDGLLDGVAPGSLVVDLGCGPGVEAGLMRDLGHHVVAVDLSTTMTRLTRDRGLPVLAADLRRLPIADDAADVVWSSAALLHIPRAETASTLAEWRRVTRTGGRLALSTSEGDDEGWEDVPYGPNDAGRPRRRWFVHRTRGELVDALLDAGWSVEQVGSRESHRRWHLVRAHA